MNINILATCVDCKNEVQVHRMYVDCGNNLYFELDSCSFCVERAANASYDEGKEVGIERGKKETQGS